MYSIIDGAPPFREGGMTCYTAAKSQCTLGMTTNHTLNCHLVSLAQQTTCAPTNTCQHVSAYHRLMPFNLFCKTKIVCKRQGVEHAEKIMYN